MRTRENSASAEWVRVQRAGWWAPTDVGESIEGVFCGVTCITGEHGGFDVAQVRRDDGSIVSAGGKHLLTQIEDAALLPGDRIRVVFEGMQRVPRKKFEMRMFGLFVEAKRAPTQAAKGGAA